MLGPVVTVLVFRNYRTMSHRVCTMYTPIESLQSSAETKSDYQAVKMSFSPVKLPFRNKGEIKTVSDQQTLRKYQLQPLYSRTY